MNRPVLITLLVLLAHQFVHAQVPADHEKIVAPTVDFNADVRPLLARRCFVCHGPDVSTRKSGLRVDEREAAITPTRPGHTPAIVPGDPDASALIARVTAADVDDRMPPEGDALTAEEVDVLRRWIAEGAVYDVHWSWRAVADPPPPAVRDATWSRDAIDRFVLARLEAHEMAPAPNVDRAALLRRLSFDLIGLPPTPEEIDAFVADSSDDAYARQVDRLLVSPHFGERWGRHWLDLMRYAETHGHEFDYPIRHAYEYRDYIIRALNADVPYDQFVIEHLAGDLVDPPRRHPVDEFDESIIGTGWWYFHQATHGPVDVRGDEAERVDNQIDVFSKTFLAATVSCARCHDHKFDPISTADYYGLAGFLQSSRRQEAYLDPGHGIDVAVTALRDQNERVTDLVARFRSTPGPTPDLTPWIDAAFACRDGEPASEERAIVFADFEGDEYDDWIVEGTAFGDAPQRQGTVPEYQGDVGGHGAGFVNTHARRGREAEGGDDGATGTLTSQPFTIERRFISFLIGGGNHPGRTGLELLVDGEVARSATGRNSNRMHRDQFDVTELIGRTATLRVVDRETGGWGQVGLDHVLFSDAFDFRLRRPVASVATARDLDEAWLERWVRALLDGPPPAGPVDSARDDAPFVLADFDAGAPEGWTTTGWAWSVGSTSPRPFVNDARLRIAPGGVAHSGLTGASLQGTLRSPTFTIDQPYLDIRAAGTGGRIRLVVDGYYLDEFNALLFEGFSIGVDTGDPGAFRWFRQDATLYLGHRAYLEFIDDGSGTLVVDDVMMRSGPRPADSMIEDATPARLAGELAGALDNAILAWRDDALDAHAVTHLDWMLRQGLMEGGGALAQAIRRVDELDHAPAPRRVLAITDGTPEDEHVFVRGSHRELGPLVPRRFIESLSAAQSPIAGGSGRLVLAQRVLDRENPLVSRAVVNRVWGHLLGRPIVGTPDDFGALGRMPTHPDLLDFLATWFRTEADWSTKALIRRIVMSRTYRIARETADSEATSKDPLNALLHRVPRRRLQGEAIRDAILSISGRLDRTMYGPSVPVHVTEFMTGRGRPKSGPIDGAGRRSIYVAVRRNFLSPFMLAFDTPVPSSSIGRRNESNVPAQALILMNDPFVIQEARRWAERILERDEPDAAARVVRMYREAVGRSPTPAEIDGAVAFLQDQARAHAEADPDDWRRNLSAWSDLAHVMFNLKEFIYLR